jgi:UDP-N-acetylglucosamine 2-epimerase (non-hydrolysing)
LISQLLIAAKRCRTVGRKIEVFIISTPSKQVFFYLGTEAEFIKLYPVIEKCIQKGLDVKLICNGQNPLRDSILMTDSMLKRSVFLLRRPIWFPFDKFSLRALWLVFWVIVTLFKTFGFLFGLKKDGIRMPLFIVHGDTVSTLIGTFVAKTLGYTILHVESGLTSGMLFNPFPEEICRRIVTRISSIRFCPTVEAINHVRDRPGKRKLLSNGNTMWDMLQYGLKTGKTSNFAQYFLLIIHRQETLANPALFFEIFQTVKQHRPADLTCVFVMHNPTKSFLLAHGKFDEVAGTPGWKLVDRLPFLDFTHLLKNAQCVLTDGGSNQEECYYLGVPCYLLRDRTERHEGLGANVVLKPDYVRHITWFMENYKDFRRDTVILEHSPSEIVATEIVRECSR